MSTPFSKDLVEPDGTWAGLYAYLGPEKSDGLSFETFHQRRFRLTTDSGCPVLWGNIEADYWGANLLKSLRLWERSDMPVPPITSQEVEAANDSSASRHSFWTHFFFEKMMARKASPLKEGSWFFGYYVPRRNTDTYHSVRPSFRFGNEWIWKTRAAFDQETLMCSDWQNKVVSLKPRSDENASRGEVVEEKSAPRSTTPNSFVACSHDP